MSPKDLLSQAREALIAERQPAAAAALPVDVSTLQEAIVAIRSMHPARIRLLPKDLQVRIDKLAAVHLR